MCKANQQFCKRFRKRIEKITLISVCVYTIMHSGLFVLFKAEVIRNVYASFNQGYKSIQPCFCVCERERQRQITSKSPLSDPMSHFQPLLFTSSCPHSSVTPFHFSHLYSILSHSASSSTSHPPPLEQIAFVFLICKAR